MFPASFEDLQKEIYPRWAQAPKWTKFLRSMTGHLDDLVERHKRTIGARLVEKAPDDALEAIGGNCNLPRPRGMGAIANYRSYLRRPFERWYFSGTTQGLANEIKALGYSSVAVITYQMLIEGGLPPATTFGGFSSFFYVLIRKPNPWTQAGKWGRPPLGSGAKWGAAPFTWGSTATYAEIEEIRRVIRQFKPAGESCRYIEAWLDVDLFGLPKALVRWPVHEDWEIMDNGSARSFYNNGFDRP